MQRDIFDRVSRHPLGRAELANLEPVALVDKIPARALDALARRREDDPIDGSEREDEKEEG